MPKKVQDDILTETAKAIGTAAGKIASLAGVAEHAPATKAKAKVGKLQKKNNVHLPRKVKKHQKKLAAAKSKA